ncbi:hypothetical protein NXX64_21550 [Bacteroides fragilis]|nr:hypothetical protein [Bacteroides fragilis]
MNHIILTYMFEYAGVDPKTGNEMYYKNDGTNETTTLTSEAQKVMNEGIMIRKKVEGGLTLAEKWKFIDLNLTVTYSLGGGRE